MAAQKRPVARHSDMHDPSSGRCLMSSQVALAEPLSPVGSQAAVGRTGHRIFVDARPGGEEPGNEIVLRGTGHPETTFSWVAS